MGPIESLSKTETKLKRIRWLSEQDSKKEFRNLMHLFNEDSLRECYNELDGRKAVGADGIDKEKYGENLDENLKELIAKMKRMAYRPGPVRQVLIPKAGQPNAKRPLGICSFEDKIVQKMMQKVLENIYDPQFLKCSYGFRAGIGCHDAIKDLRDHLFQQEVETVIDIDLANFFGAIDHQEVLNILRIRIKDQTLIRYIARMFKSGVLADGDLTVSEEGVVQGSPCSPTIANIFAHYVIDEWFEDVVKKHIRGRATLLRYGDDAVICCQFKEDAARIRSALSKRLEKYKLKLNEEKTSSVSFSRSKYEQGEKQGVFHFLGFTFYWGKSRKGYSIPKVMTQGKRMRSKLKNVNEWARSIRNKYRLKIIWSLFCSKLTGHIRYFGVSFNGKRVATFVDKAVRILFKWLNRRSQRKSFNWEKFRLFVKEHPLPKVQVIHPLF
ncbi:MAG: group II intron reverse transcriptase/maturase [Alphaproteobacteria bacterium]|nr:group II intron reverse transcriptase/maturase [Alphaproteobacteria bacterium]